MENIKESSKENSKQKFQLKNGSEKYLFVDKKRTRARSSKVAKRVSHLYLIQNTFIQILNVY